MESDEGGSDTELERNRSILLSNSLTDADETFPFSEAAGFEDTLEVGFKLGPIFPSSTSETESFASGCLLGLGATDTSTADGGDKVAPALLPNPQSLSSLSLLLSTASLSR
jgi:hypothetical protein